VRDIRIWVEQLRRANIWQKSILTIDRKPLFADPFNVKERLMTRYARGKTMFACFCLAMTSPVVARSAEITSPIAYPAKPIRLVVPFAPGGGADILSRMVAQQFTELTRQAVVVDNRPGASGMIGTGFVAKAPADGYTIGIVPADHTINPSLYSKVPYDAIADFSPITQATTYAAVLVVHSSLPVKNVKDLISLAKSKPGQVVYASAGVGGAPHLSAELFNSMAGTKMIHVPYKGTGAALSDLLAGQTQLMFANPLAILPHVKNGRLRALGVAGMQRSPAVPDLPTIHESGLPGFETNGWFGFLAPAGTPRQIVEFLNEKISAIVHLPGVKDRLLSQGHTPVGSKSDEFSRHLSSELEKWRKVVQASGAKAN